VGDLFQSNNFFSESLDSDFLLVRLLLQRYESLLVLHRFVQTFVILNITLENLDSGTHILEFALLDLHSLGKVSVSHSHV